MVREQSRIACRGDRTTPVASFAVDEISPVDLYQLLGRRAERPLIECRDPASREGAADGAISLRARSGRNWPAPSLGSVP
jgi:hypothetical protein